MILLAAGVSNNLGIPKSLTVIGRVFPLFYMKERREMN
jgi:hypothetical protein